MAQRLIAGGAVLLLALGVSSAGQAALAQEMRDPMRPPHAALERAPDGKGGQAATAQAGPAAPRLQSVLISPNRRLAVIDGNTVPLGGRVGDATLVSITESEVVLVKENARETLRLFPGVQKTPVPRHAPSKVIQ